MLMDSAYIEEHQIIHRYHLKKLNETELNAFEIYIIEHPEIISELERDKELSLAFKENKSLLKANKQSNLNYTKAYAIAASLVLTITILFSPVDKERATNAQLSYPLQPAIILQSFRGNTLPLFSASGQPATQFQIDMGPVQLIRQNSFTVEVIEAVSKQILYSENGLSVDSDGWLNYSLLTQSAPLSGLFQIRITADDDSSDIILFEVEFTH